MVNVFFFVFFFVVFFVKLVPELLDGWMTCKLTSFSTVSQPYQSANWELCKAMCNETVFTVGKVTASSASHTELLGLPTVEVKMIS